MFVHLGGDAVVDVREVVAVLDVQRVSKSELVQELIDRAAKTRPGVTNPRAVVVATKGTFLSTISVATIAKRIRRMSKSGRERMAKKQTGQGFPPLTLGANQ
jgi:uncharacterized protein DUF370